MTTGNENQAAAQASMWWKSPIGKLSIAIAVGAAAILFVFFLITASLGPASGVSKQDAATMESEIKSHLVDPDSAKFTWWDYPNKGFYCGLLNARNRMGGYTGNTLFYASPSPLVSGLEQTGEDEVANYQRSIVVSVCTSSGYREQLLKAGYVIPEDTAPAKPEPAKPKVRFVPVAIPATGPLNAAQLESAAFEAHTFHPKDAFSVPPSQKNIIGRAFDVVIPLVESKGGPCGRLSGGTWEYRAADQKLVLSLCKDMWNSAFALDGDYANFWDHVDDLNGFTFGRFPSASADDASEDDDYVLSAVASFNRRILELAWPDYNTTLTKSVAMPPDQARKMVTSLRLHVYGTVRAFTGDHAVACGKYGGDEHTTCVITADLTRLVVENSSSGAALATWAKRGH